MVPRGLARRLVASDNVSAISKMEIWGRGEGLCFWQRPGGGKEAAGAFFLTTLWVRLSSACLALPRRGLR